MSKGMANSALAVGAASLNREAWNNAASLPAISTDFEKLALTPEIMKAS